MTHVSYPLTLSPFRDDLAKGAGVDLIRGVDLATYRVIRILNVKKY